MLLIYQPAIVRWIQSLLFIKWYVAIVKIIRILKVATYYHFITPHFSQCSSWLQPHNELLCEVVSSIWWSAWLLDWFKAMSGHIIVDSYIFQCLSPRTTAYSIGDVCMAAIYTDQWSVPGIIYWHISYVASILSGTELIGQSSCHWLVIPSLSSPKFPLPIFLPTLQFGPTMRTLELLLLVRELAAPERPPLGRSSGCMVTPAPGLISTESGATELPLLTPPFQLTRCEIVTVFYLPSTQLMSY